MATVTVIGMGPGPLSLLTKEAESELLLADKVFFRTGAHPVYNWVRDLGKRVVPFDCLYGIRWSNRLDLYEFITHALFKEATIRGRAVYAVPGSPFVLEDTTRLIRQRGPIAGIEVKVLDGMSFLETALSAVNFDWSVGLQIVLPWTHLQYGHFNTSLALLVCQIEAKQHISDPPRVNLTMKWLLNKYEPDHAVTLIWTDGSPAYRTESIVIALKHLAREYGVERYVASLYVPPDVSRKGEAISGRDYTRDTL
jgi:tetrapyrrole methylase family protein / MazG family protein